MSSLTGKISQSGGGLPWKGIFLVVVLALLGSGALLYQQTASVTTGVVAVNSAVDAAFGKDLTIPENWEDALKTLKAALTEGTITFEEAGKYFLKLLDVEGLEAWQIGLLQAALSEFLEKWMDEIGLEHAAGGVVDARALFANFRSFTDELRARNVNLGSVEAFLAAWRSTLAP